MTDVAAFDFDGTLTEGGSVFEFLTAVAGTWPVLAATLALAPRLAHAAVVGGTVADATKELLFRRVLTGMPEAQVGRVALQFADTHLANHIRDDVRRRFDWHRLRGDKVVIVSASPDLYVREVGALLGADGVVATHLAVGDDGRLTGRYNGANCRGEEKIRRLRQWIASAGVDPTQLWAYGNSRGDLRMLRAADIGVDVGRFGRFGKLRSFPGLAETEGS
jgi:phosphatidylglycerophosphatase C